jgi:hypothetical protein
MRKKSKTSRYYSEKFKNKALPKFFPVKSMPTLQERNIKSAEK